MALLNIFSKLSNFAVSKILGNTVIRSSSSLPEELKNKSDAILETVKTLADANLSRNFAIIHVMGKQFKVTDGDLIIVEGYWAPTKGDEVNFNKVLLAGTKDFSLIGTPLVQSGLVSVRGTIIGKRLSHTRSVFHKKRRKQYMRMNFVRTEQTTVRINCVTIGSNINP